MQNSFSFGIARRLFAVSIVITLSLAALGAYAFIQLGSVSRLADNTEHMRVAQLKAMAELELNVTQVSLQLRHAILARTPEELASTLAYIVDKRKGMGTVLDGFEQRLFSADGKEHFTKLPPAIAEFWKVGESNLKLIQAGQKDEAFAYLVENTIPARNRLLTHLHDGYEIQSRGLASDISAIEHSVSSTSRLIIAAALAIAASLMGFSWYLASLLRRRVMASQAVAERVRDGDLSTDIRDTAQDEFSPLMATLRDMQASLIRVVAGFAKELKASPRPVSKSPRGIPTCPAAPSTRPLHWSRRLPPWSSWAARRVRTPTAPVRPASSPAAPAAWRSRVVTW